MIKNVRYVKLQEVLSRVLRNPLLKDTNMEQAVQYAVDFIHIFGLPEMYEDKEIIVEIENHRGELPCELISINQVMDLCTHSCMRSMTDTFFPTDYQRGKKTAGYIGYADELTFKVQNHIMFTSFTNGKVKVNYKAIPVDENGFPLIPDNPTYLSALEQFIKVQVFTILFDQGKIKGDVLQHTEQQYAWRAGQLTSEYNIPSESEMESICRSWTTLIQRTTDFDNGFKNLGDREYLRKH